MLAPLAPLSGRSRSVERQWFFFGNYLFTEGERSLWESAFSYGACYQILGTIENVIKNVRFNIMPLMKISKDSLIYQTTQPHNKARVAVTSIFWLHVKYGGHVWKLPKLKSESWFSCRRWWWVNLNLWICGLFWLHPVASIGLFSFGQRTDLSSSLMN